MRFTVGLQVFFALVSMQLLMAPCVRADDDQPVAAPKTAESMSADETKHVLDDLTADSAAAQSESHRRRAAKKAPSAALRSLPRQTAQAAPIAVTELPTERLNQLCAGDAELAQPIIVPSTLAEAMRRVALWGDSCPFCGHAHAGKNATDAERQATAPSKVTDGKLLNVEAADQKSDDKPSAQPLRSGEPAQVILDTQKRIGKSVLDGTEFSGSPELLIQWIRVLDEENRRRQALLEETTRAEIAVLADEDEAVTTRSQIEALREACRELQQAADLLEEQNLFESADSIRGFADVLRRQSRQKLSHLDPASDDAPTSSPLGEPRHANSKR